MPQRPFRFLHAANLQLDQPVAGLTDVPEHLVDLLIDGPARAAVRVFDAAIDQRVDFVLLAGGVIDPPSCARANGCFWSSSSNGWRIATSRCIGPPGSAIWLTPGPSTWPGRPTSEFFRAGKCSDYGTRSPANRFVKSSAAATTPMGFGQPADFAPSRTNLFALALAHAAWPADVLANIGLDYWALGGRHDRSTPIDLPHCVVHYCGSPQGRQPRRNRPARLHVGIGRRARTRPAFADCVRRRALPFAAACHWTVGRSTGIGTSSAAARRTTTGRIRWHRVVHQLDHCMSGRAAGGTALRAIGGGADGATACRVRPPPHASLDNRHRARTARAFADGVVQGGKPAWRFSAGGASGGRSTIAGSQSGNRGIGRNFANSSELACRHCWSPPMCRRPWLKKSAGRRCRSSGLKCAAACCAKWPGWEPICSVPTS